MSGSRMFNYAGNTNLETFQEDLRSEIQMLRLLKKNIYLKRPEPSQKTETYLLLLHRELNLITTQNKNPTQIELNRSASKVKAANEIFIDAYPFEARKQDIQTLILNKKEEVNSILSSKVDEIEKITDQQMYRNLLKLESSLTTVTDLAALNQYLQNYSQLVIDYGADEFTELNLNNETVPELELDDNDLYSNLLKDVETELDRLQKIHEERRRHAYYYGETLDVLNELGGYQNAELRELKKRIEAKKSSPQDLKQDLLQISEYYNQELQRLESGYANDIYNNEKTAERAADNTIRSLSRMHSEAISLIKQYEEKVRTITASPDDPTQPARNATKKVLIEALEQNKKVQEQKIKLATQHISEINKALGESTKFKANNELHYSSLALLEKINTSRQAAVIAINNHTRSSTEIEQQLSSAEKDFVNATIVLPRQAELLGSYNLFIRTKNNIPGFKHDLQIEQNKIRDVLRDTTIPKEVRQLAEASKVVLNNLFERLSTIEELIIAAQKTHDEAAKKLEEVLVSPTNNHLVTAAIGMVESTESQKNQIKEATKKTEDDLINARKSIETLQKTVIDLTNKIQADQEKLIRDQLISSHGKLASSTEQLTHAKNSFTANIELIAKIPPENLSENSKQLLDRKKAEYTAIYESVGTLHTELAKWYQSTRASLQNYEHSAPKDTRILLPLTTQTQQLKNGIDTLDSRIATVKSAQKEMNEHTRSLLIEAAENAASKLEEKINSTKSKIAELQEKITDAKDIIENFDDQLRPTAQYSTNIQTLGTALTKAENALADFKDELAENEATLLSLNEKRENLSPEISLTPLQETEVIDKITAANRSISTLETQKDNIQHEFTELEKEYNKVLPPAKPNQQNIAQLTAAQFDQTTKFILGKNYKNTIEHNTSLVAIIKTSASARRKIHSTLKNLELLDQKLENYLNSIEAHQARLNGITKAEMKDQVMQYHNQIDKLRRELENMEMAYPLKYKPGTNRADQPQIMDVSDETKYYADVGATQADITNFIFSPANPPAPANNPNLGTGALESSVRHYQKTRSVVQDEVTVHTSSITQADTTKPDVKVAFRQSATKECQKTEIFYDKNAIRDLHPNDDVFFQIAVKFIITHKARFASQPVRIQGKDFDERVIRAIKIVGDHMGYRFVPRPSKQYQPHTKKDVENFAIEFNANPNRFISDDVSPEIAQALAIGKGNKVGLTPFAHERGKSPRMGS